MCFGRAVGASPAKFTAFEQILQRLLVADRCPGLGSDANTPYPDRRRFSSNAPATNSATAGAGEESPARPRFLGGLLNARQYACRILHPHGTRLHHGFSPT
jgi:hypothetical protein